MAEKYYVDTSIWMDLLEDRKGFDGMPLGDYALKLFAMIKAKNCTLVISDLLIKELGSYYSSEEINGMVLPFKDIMERVLLLKCSVMKPRELRNRESCRQEMHFTPFLPETIILLWLHEINISEN